MLTLSRITKLPGTAINQLQIRPSDAWAETAGELGEYADWLLSQGLIHPFSNAGAYRLTLNGWDKVEDLLRQRQAGAHRAFIAMKYGDHELDPIVANYFQPACAQAGFDLRRLDQKQAAGLIDDQLRVAIRTAQFLVCDLTHGNRGAYWEAGFAEGLGRPVIYICRADVFNDRTHACHPHFDASHMVTIQWDPTAPQIAAQKLKDTVRATFPNEAQLED